MNRPTEQIYSNYTEADFQVWKTLFDRQMQALSPVVAEEYLNAIDKVGFSAHRIPDFAETDARLSPLTGWSIQVVPCICPQKEFFQFLSQRRFTATCWLRTPEQLDYLEEPDMFHDVFGHIPLLSNNDYCNFFKGISDIALKYINSPLAIELLSRVYWYTIEFGVMKEKEKTKIYGAGIISSHSETRHALNNNTELLDFDIRNMLNTSYRTDVVQEKYFVIDSFEQLYHSLPYIDTELERILSSEVVYNG